MANYEPHYPQSFLKATGDNTPASPLVVSVAIDATDVAVTVTPVCDTAAYASGDLIFDSTAIAGAVRAVGGHCVLRSVLVHDKADQGVAMTLVLLNALTDMGALNSAPDPDDAEASTIIGWVPVAAADYIDVGASKVATIRNIGLGLKAEAASTTLYVAAINGTGTPTYGAGDLVLTFYFERA